ncbi:hypothetical protein [Parasitella parasitica]|uniref:Phosphatidylinositol transfer protein N-terminal domain-containing protein n=1 Tax=Parasitella parasitica TaxID=35722 RepID=A0A0B7N5H0_9FUNG|nr:hypothetical protein [Parasitella parasitica]
MIINEYRIINNCTQEEYQVAQLYATAQSSKENTGGGEGVEVIKNEPYEKGEEKGQYTYKIFRLASRVPAIVKAIAPAGALDLYEEAWNAYPYLLKNGYMKEAFSIVYETLHVDGSRGEIENALNIKKEGKYMYIFVLSYLKKRNVIIIDIANDKIESKNYKEEEDPKLYHSEKTGRGPLTEPDWQKTVEPVMTCYKLVYIEFKWFGIQTKVESFLASTVQTLFTKFHRQLFCWTDKWYGMSIQDIRDLEEQTKNDLNAKRNEGDIPDN